jgi:tryptophanyl-tRNA synthetase
MEGNYSVFPMNKRLFSGIQPSGDLHLGNYLGAIKQWIPLQDEYDAFFSVVDLHAITVLQDPVALRLKTLEVAKIYLAAGIDPGKATLFVQSHIPEHTELMWILNTIARLGDLEKMTQFKDKSVKSERETVGVGLFDYPVLMAADILLYDTATVPVGEDQVQHVELTRTLARRFNAAFGETFVVPEPRVMKEGARIMGLDDPTKKMSKSATSEYNFIALSDDPEKAKKKIMKAVTDSGTEIAHADDKPALKNLITIYSLLGNKNTDEIVAMYQGKGYADFKRDLAEVVASFLVDFQKKLADISDEEAMNILRAGAGKARAVASAKLKTVKDKIGFLE